MENFEDNIEKEYHERFQDFEEMPDDAVWNKIQERITPEPERRPIVFWWNNYRSMGIAASILLGLLGGGYLFSTFFDITKSQSTKITKSTPVGEKKQTTQATQLLTKNSTLINATSEKTNEAGNAAEKQVKTIITTPETRERFIASKTFNENEPTINEPKVEELKKETFSFETLAKQEQVDQGFESKTQNQTIINGSELVSSNPNSPQNTTKTTEERTTISTEKSKLFSDQFAFLMPKNTDIQSVNKVLNVPVLPQSEAVFAFEEPRRDRLVFIPPTEIYANVSPMLSYYVFSPNRADNFVVKDFNSSSNRLSFAAQLGVVYPLGKKLDIRTGLSFMAGKSNFSYGLTNNSQKVVKVIDELNIEVQPVNSINIEQKNWQYVELQSDLLYSVKKLHAVSVGFRAGVQTSALNKPVFNGRIGYRISKPVNNRVALWLEPSVVISLSSQESIDNHFMYHTTGFGLNMGVSLLRQD
ncbi:hypothetical protein [Emticicia sp. W12TSBA100-4]|uniref:hypothetical protein n=1 Tax=Emticicia sp. W12TSBA100-4 TaxID=3160965 RepID=UPI003305C718